MLFYRIFIEIKLLKLNKEYEITIAFRTYKNLSTKSFSFSKFFLCIKIIPT